MCCVNQVKCTAWRLAAHSLAAEFDDKLRTRSLPPSYTHPELLSPNLGFDALVHSGGTLYVTTRKPFIVHRSIVASLPEPSSRLHPECPRQLTTAEAAYTRAVSVVCALSCVSE